MDPGTHQFLTAQVFPPWAILEWEGDWGMIVNCKGSVAFLHYHEPRARHGIGTQ